MIKRKNVKLLKKYLKKTLNDIELKIFDLHLIGKIPLDYSIAGLLSMLFVNIIIYNWWCNVYII